VRDQLPAPLVEAARGARTALLRVASPAEAAWRILTGRPAGPPLWLKRHAGPVRAFESAAADCRAQLLAWNALAREGRIVDLGCGPGAMALALAGDLAPGARYVGIDVHAASIAWCRRRFAGDARFRFEDSEVVSSYGRGGVALADYRLPIDDGSADLVLAKSLFTHLSEPEAERYFSEIARILAPGGRALVTAFTFGANDVPAFPHGGDRFRWRRKSRPAAATAFARPAWGGMIRKAGLMIEREAPGFYPGNSDVFSGQDTLLLALAAQR
jgi:SAM-dependent methyltransferase